MKRVFVFKSEGSPDVLLYKDKTNYQLAVRDQDGTITKGQWLVHVKINPRNCSYNGRYFGYHYMALRDDNGGRAYSVISTPPYFTAHILWEECGMWSSGPQLIKNIVHLYYRTQTRYLRGTLPEDLTIDDSHRNGVPHGQGHEIEYHESTQEKFTHVVAPYDMRDRDLVV